MSGQEQLDQFRAILLLAMNVFRESRKDIAKLQTQVIALKEAIARIEPKWSQHFQGVLADVEKLVVDHKTSVDVALEKELDDVILLLSSDNKRVH
jgi:hypothetical protein